MNRVMTVAQRELGAYFLSPIAYVVLAIFLFTTGLAFALGTFQPGAEASLRSMMQFWMILILTLVVPMLTMRLMSDELRTGTVETLMTVPITDAEVILGKFLGAMGFFVAMLCTTLIYPIILAMFGSVDIYLLLCNFLGLLLLGGLFVSIGLFFSTCTQHQVVAVLLTAGVLAFLTFAFSRMANLLEGWTRALMQQLSIDVHFMNFVRGLVDLNNVVFFLTTTGFFIFLTVKRLEMRRWQ